MKYLLGTVAALLVSTAIATAQGGSSPTAGTPGEVVVTTLALEHEIPTINARKVRYAWTVTITGRSNGVAESAIDVASIAVSGDVEELGTMTTAEIFDVICSRSVIAIAGITDGDSPASGAARISTAGCVTRTATGFAAAGSGSSRRTYRINRAPLGSSAALASLSVTTGCESPAEPTWSATGAVLE